MTVTRVTRAFITLILLTIMFAPYEKVEAVTKTGVVDVGKTVLNVRSGPGTNYSKIGTLKDKEAVTVYSINKGWAQISFRGKNGYVSDAYLRFYSPLAESTAKLLVNLADRTERITWEKDYTLLQIHSIMSPQFTKSYIDRYIKQQFRPAGKDKNGTPLYHIIETEIWGLALYPLDWKAEYEPKKPVISHFVKKGQEYLYVSQFHLNEESGNKTTTICFIKSGTKWLVNDHLVTY